MDVFHFKQSQIHLNEKGKREEEIEYGGKEKKWTWKKEDEDEDEEEWNKKIFFKYKIIIL